MMRYKSVSCLFLYALLIGSSCSPRLRYMNYKETQFTFDNTGHTIHNTQIFSPHDKWIVFDTRNADTLIGSTEFIKMVNVKTKNIETLYKTTHQTNYGPGVGAATFSPAENKVVFIHGIRNANKDKPYAITRRTGVVIDINNPFHPILIDARDIIAPFTPGALRGGTHAHSWSGDGKWISFTYNDYIIEQLSKTDPSVHDLRVIGVMVPGKVKVESDSTMENNSGEMFAVVVTTVNEHAKPGSNEINKAFDEGWIGRNGYIKEDGSRQQRAIAFQGNVRNEAGKLKTEVFVVDLPDEITVAQPGKPLEGTDRSRPFPPQGTVQRRLTFTESGIEGPRHWLRSTPDGAVIAYLAKDKNAIVQIFSVTSVDGKIKQLTDNPHPVQGPFNFSPDGKYIAYNADNSVFITDLKTGKSSRITEKKEEEEKPLGAPVWSNKGDKIAFNRYVKTNEGKFIQIFVLEKK